MKNSTIFIVSVVVLLSGLSLFSQKDELKMTSFEGKLEKVDQDWFLNSEKDVFRLDLGPEDFLAENGFNLSGTEQVQVEGILREKEITVYVISDRENEVKLRDQDGQGFWEDTDVIPASYYVVEPRKCIACRLCIPNCPVKAITMEKGVAYIDPQTCISCGICVSGNRVDFKGCPVGAIKKSP